MMLTESEDKRAEEERRLTVDKSSASEGEEDMEDSRPRHERHDEHGKQILRQDENFWI